MKNIIRHFILIPLRSGSLLRTLVRTPRFVRQWNAYKKVTGERVPINDWFPCLHDNVPSTPFDPHYFYQSAWAASKISQEGVKHHVDIGSQINFIAPLSGFVDVEFIDIRSLEAKFPRLKSVTGSVLSLPYPDKSIQSLSCLHVIEHIGLGRYGDSLDSMGARKACKELQRVLAMGGNLYLTVPIGREKVQFNAHRIFYPEAVVDLFDELKLVDFSCVDDTGKFIVKGNMEICKNFSYGLGLFHFRRLVN